MKSEPQTEVSKHLPLKLNLLGNMELQAGDGAPSDTGYAKLRALLAFLAMAEGKPQRRDLLAEMLWPDMALSAAKQNLRRALFNLKSLLGDASHLLSSTTSQVTLTTEGLCLDVNEFALEHDYSDPAQMAQLAALYRGEFMAGFSLPDCPDFEDWLQAQREALHRRALLLLDRLAALHEQTSDYGKALPAALRYAELTPWDEAGQRRAMRLLAQNGQDSAALSHYNTFRKMLKAELGVLPEVETRTLAEHIRKGVRLVSPVASPAPATLHPLAERRQVTVLFCELPVAMYDDPEEAMAQLHQPQERRAQLIRQFGGHIVQTHGGSLLAYFGYPQAREDAARRAVQAALAVSRKTQDGIEVRACVHTGLIITGGNGNMPDTAGKTSSLAMRLRHGAGSHPVTISGETMRLVAGYFDCTPLGHARFEGFSQPVELFGVERETGALTRLDAAAQLTPLAGRHAEFGVLKAAWAEAARGSRRVVLVRGEAGIGKSRLLLALKESLGDQAFLLPELRCFPEYSQSPFYPLIAMLEAMLLCKPGDTPEAKFEKLVPYMAILFPEQADQATPLLASLMSLPLRAPFRMPDIPPPKIKEATIAILLQLLRLIAAQQPVLMVMEDLHWIDPSSLEMINRFIADASPCAVLAVCTARPEFTPAWAETNARILELAPLDMSSVKSMIASLRSDMTQELAHRIAERSDGVPLFVEEMTRDADAQTGIPATLHDLLAARMDALGAAKHVAQLAATLGREFRLDWLREIYRNNDLPQLLDALRDAGLVLPVDESTQQFKHALFQEAAYQSQTRQHRLNAHALIAQMLQRNYADVAANQPELLAQHLAAAGENLPAVEYWMMAGQRAMQHSANEEAIGHFRNALDILKLLPADARRDTLEAGLNLYLGTTFIVSRGYGSLDARAAFARAQELGEQLGDASMLFTAIWGKWLGASSCENYVHAAELAERLFALAQTSLDPVQLQQAHLAVGDCHLWRGQVAQACDYFERGLALYQPQHHREMVIRAGENIAVSIGSQLVWALWLRGDAEQAAAIGQRTQALVQQLDHPYSIGYIQTHLMILARWNGDVDGMHQLAEQTMVLAQRHGFHIWMVSALAFHGLALCKRGDNSGIAELQQAVATVHAVMSGVEAFFISALAEGLGDLGQYAEALRTMDDALASAETKDNLFWKSEMLRLKGEYLLQLDPSPIGEAKKCFQQALKTSERQGACALSLRARDSLERLRRQGGR